MAQLAHATVSVGTTAQTLLTVPSGSRKVILYVRNNHATQTVYVGDNTVTASGATQGIGIAPTTVQSFEFSAGTPVSAIASGAGTSVSYMWTAL